MVQTNIQVNVVDRTANALGRISGRLSALNKGLLGINRVAGIVTGALAGIGGAQAVKGIIATTSRFQDLNTTLATVTGSAQAGAQAFDFIGKFSTQTQFGVEELTQAYIKLAANGIDPSEELLGRFANAAAVTTDQVGSLEAITDLYSRSLQSQTIELQNLDRLADRGFPVYDIIKEKLGVTRDEISKFSKEAGNTEKILDAIGGTIDERFGDATKNLLQNLSIQFSNFNIAVKDAQFLIGQSGLAKAIGDTAVELTEFIQSNDEAAQKIGVGLTKAFLFVKEAIILVAQNLDLLAKAFAVFFGAKIALGITALALAFGSKLARGVLIATKALKTLALVTARHPLIAGALVISVGINKLTGVFDKLAESVLDLGGDALGKAGDEIKEFAAEAAKGIDGFEDFSQSIDSIFRGNMGTFTGGIAAMAEGMIGAQKTSKELTDQQDDLNDSLGEGEKEAKKFGGSIQEAFQISSKGAQDAITSFDEYQHILDAGNNLVNTFRTRTAEAFADAVLGAKSFAEGLKEVTEALVRGVIVAIAELAIQIFILEKFIEPLFRKMVGGTEDAVNSQKKLNSQLRTEIGLRAILSFFTGGFSNILPSFRADGGPVNAGQQYIVGEEGPELFVPRQSGRIVPNDALSPNSSTFGAEAQQPASEVNVNFNIQTVDAESFDELLVSRRGIITSIINESMFRQGKRGLV